MALRQTVLSQQTAFSRAQTEATTGKVADVGLSLGYATGQTISFAASQSQLQAITDTNAIVSTRLSSTQSALGAIGTTAQSMLNALVSGADNAAAMTALATQAKSSLEALTAQLDTTVGGQYIFAGINTDAKPVTDYVQSPPTANKQAVDTAFSNTFGFAQTDPAAASISGSDMQSFLDTQFSGLFQGSAWTSTWSQASDQPLNSRISTSQTIDTSVSANRSGFQKLAEAYAMLTEFGGGNVGESATAAVQTSARSLIGAAMHDLTNAQAGVGVAQSSITQANAAMSTQIDVLTTSLGNLVNVDPYVAATRVTQLQTQLQASYQLTSQLHQMSLLNYLNNA